MKLRPAPSPLALASSLLLATTPLASAASEETMRELFKILRDRGSISQAEFQQLEKMSAEDRQEREALERRPVAAAPGALNGSTLEVLDQMDDRLRKSEAKLASMEQKATGKQPAFPLRLGNLVPWFDKLKIDGYTQFRFNTLLNDNADRLHVPADRSVDEDETFLIRRGRFKITGDVTEHLYLYAQFDFFGTVFGSGGSLGLQARDLYADFSFDTEKVHRLRVGQSKVPFGWVNMQSSQNRAPLERPDSINSAFEGERDIGLYYLFTPEGVRERFKELANAKLKGSGDYGMFTVGAINGQGLNRSDVNGEPHVVARITYPWKLPNGQFLEASLQGYHGKFVSGTKEFEVDGVTFDPQVSDNGVDDHRVGVSAILYPQPFGLEMEWNVGQGPELSEDRTKVEKGFLHGGYIQANYLLPTPAGRFFPFVRWHYYDGARKFADNAPRTKVNELDIGFEWAPYEEFELSLMYTHTFERTNTSRAPYDAVENASRIGFQIQWNY